MLGESALIDAGTGVVDLALDELARIERIFVTHSHLDHVLGIPLLLDSIGSRRDRPLLVHALPATIDSLKRHLFNWSIWPDFTVIPSPEHPGLVFEPMVSGQSVELDDGTRVTALPAVHVVPALGFQVDGRAGSLVFTGDTTCNPALWPHLDRIANLRHLIIECAFAEVDRPLAEVSCHLCPSLLASELAQLRANPLIHITHLKPGESEATMRDIGYLMPARAIQRLREGEVFEL
jgi:ribonuclease BN (tRNA processing enzyme)